MCIQPTPDATINPLLGQFMSFGQRLHPQLGSYYSNLTGYWKGDVRFHNLTQESHPLSSPDIISTPPWSRQASDYLIGANLTNATEFAQRLGAWNWTRSEKVDISFGDKLVWSERNGSEVSKDVAILHVSPSLDAYLALRLRRPSAFKGKIDFTDPDSSEEFRLELNGVHFVSNGSIYALAKPSGYVV